MEEEKVFSLCLFLFLHLLLFYPHFCLELLWHPVCFWCISGLNAFSWPHSELLSQLRLNIRLHRPWTLSRYREENKTNLYPTWSPPLRFSLFLSSPGSLSVTVLVIKETSAEDTDPNGASELFICSLTAKSRVIKETGRRGKKVQTFSDQIWFSGGN